MYFFLVGFFRLAFLALLFCAAAACHDVHLQGSPDGSESETDGLGDYLDDDASDLPCSPGSCDDGDPCTVDVCDLESGLCVFTPIDADGDGYAAASLPDGTVCSGDDCDDTQAGIHPGAEDPCRDGIDQDCDGGADSIAAIGEPLLISSEEYSAIEPHVAWSGSDFGVIWHSVISDVMNLRFTRISADGSSILDDKFLAVDSRGYLPVWNGSVYGMLQSGPGYAISLVFLSASGDYVGTPIPLDWDTFKWSNAESLLWNGSEFVFALHNERSNPPLIARIDPVSGSVSGIHDIGAYFPPEVDGTLRYFDLTWTGSEYGLVWSWETHDYYPEGYFYDCHVTTISDSGIPTNDNIVDTFEYVMGYVPSILWNGSTFTIIHQVNIYVALSTVNIISLSYEQPPVIIAICDTQWQDAILHNAGSGYIATMSETNDDSEFLQHEIYDSMGNLIDSVSAPLYEIDGRNQFRYYNSSLSDNSQMGVAWCFGGDIDNTLLYWQTIAYCM